MLYALGVIAFALGLLGSIALHEIGHMVPAKKFGVRVTQYMVGFGPTIWSKRKGETEYGVKAIPMGGYIRMIGMVPPGKDKQSRWPRRMAELVEEFRATSRAEVEPGQEHRQFYRLTPGKKMIIMLGGPTMNLLIFIFITVLLYGLIGVKGPTTTVASVSKCVVPVTSTATDCPAAGSAGYVAAPANGRLVAGDVIESINGTRISHWSQSVTIIEASAGKTLTVRVQRAGAPVTLTITPVQTTKYANDQGTKTKQAGFIGISTTQDYQRLGVAGISRVIWKQMSLGVDALKQFPSKISSLVGTVFEGKPRDAQGAVGVVGLGRIGGQIADSHQISTLDKISSLLSLLAGVNLLLFFFNLLPLLPLDGGHVAGALVESVRRGWARLRLRVGGHDAVTVGPDGKPVDEPTGQSPRPQIFVDVAQLVPVMYVVAGILIVFSVLVMYADIVKPITLN
ncbi:site-2 protease family protein [Jatrophihabitans telluris]|uniref:Site-2 protease family protein n=1 Tax=Jatrophihabitans telluris TaxID=2038343 RepID=A0ABY4R2H0_9ACTN|nr:site-2 protease family protein [Jatrophihabitans telluris]UQX90034.1 site-2 protease family protein [Jatrophihabitans telluris]